ncbi:hypothetical protein ABID26_006915 [Mesorhizobium shonense]|uniref:Uncharacterized protein n=1 Tax=Mesorhizobium shonense TaxID=1209948 RepID=A0ABV2I3J7_9HYPH
MAPFPVLRPLGCLGRFPVNFQGTATLDPADADPVARFGALL